MSTNQLMSEIAKHRKEMASLEDQLGFWQRVKQRYWNPRTLVAMKIGGWLAAAKIAAVYYVSKVPAVAKIASLVWGKIVVVVVGGIVIIAETFTS